MDYALSTEDVRKLVPELELVLYPELHLYKTLPRLSLILYFDNPNGGHWTLLINRGRTAIAFDSYGVKPDDEFKWIGRETRRAMGQPKNTLTQHLLMFDEVDYNPYQFQANSTPGNEIATCGRWCALRALLHEYNTDDFKALIDSGCAANKCTPDELVVRLTEPYLGR